jgi:hypothetical protein
MKKINLILILLLIIPFFNGCKEFLEEKPYSFIAPENFFTNATDAELALTGVYEILNANNIQGQGNHHMWGRNIHYMTYLGNDEIVGDALANLEPDYLAFSNYSYDESNPNSALTWAGLYAGINRSNYVIDRVPKIDMDETRKKEIIGEARFLRGLYYFYLGWFYGGVPINSTPEAKLKTPRSTLLEVMAFAEQDFKFAYENLPNRNRNDGRVNKFTASGFLTKLYLYLASCKEYNVGSELNSPFNSFSSVDAADMYNKAYQYCEITYTSSNYKLIRPYSYLFLAATEKEARDELMMIVQAGPGGSSEYILAAFLCGARGNAPVFGGTYGRMRPVRELYNKYNANDPRRAHNMTGFLNASSTTTVINGLRYFIPTSLNVNNFSNYCLAKYREADPLTKTSRGIGNFAGETDLGILRFADIVLMFAELKFKRADLPGARALLREVRLRAAEDDVARVNLMTASYLKTDFMAELMDERSRELCGEGWRRFDLIRTNTLKTTVANLAIIGSPINVSAVPDLKLNYQDYKIFYPIPLREIILNNALKQNTGYTQ